jgi:hypothetical protein
MDMADDDVARDLQRLRLGLGPELMARPEILATYLGG